MYINKRGKGAPAFAKASTFPSSAVACYGGRAPARQWRAGYGGQDGDQGLWRARKEIDYEKVAFDNIFDVVSF